LKGLRPHGDEESVLICSGDGNYRPDLKGLRRRRAVVRSATVEVMMEITDLDNREAKSTAFSFDGNYRPDLKGLRPIALAIALTSSAV